jgi:hypothetical protein
MLPQPSALGPNLFTGTEIAPGSAVGPMRDPSLGLPLGSLNVARNLITGTQIEPGSATGSPSALMRTGALDPGAFAPAGALNPGRTGSPSWLSPPNGGEQSNGANPSWDAGRHAAVSPPSTAQQQSPFGVPWSVQFSKFAGDPFAAGSGAQAAGEAGGAPSGPRSGIYAPT